MFGPKHLEKLVGPISLDRTKSLFQLIQDNLVSDLSLTVGLWMLDLTRNVLDAKFFIILRQSSVSELPTVISNDDQGQSEFAYDIFPYEILDVSSGY